MTDETAVAVREPSPLEGLVQAYADDFATLLPSHVPADKFVRWTLGYLRTQCAAVNSKGERPFKDALEQPHGQVSAFAGLMDCSRLGLEPGETYHLVPYRGLFTGMIDYKGDVELIGRAGGTVYCDVIYSDDDFDYNPVTSEIWHKPDRRHDRGELEGVWAFATEASGRRSRIVVMFAPELKAHEDASKAPDSISLWKTNRPVAYLKSGVHELRKWTPWSAEWQPR